MSKQSNRALEVHTTKVLLALDRLYHLTTRHNYSTGARDQVIAVIDKQWNETKTALSHLHTAKKPTDFKLEDGS